MAKEERDEQKEIQIIRERLRRELEQAGVPEAETVIAEFDLLTIDEEAQNLLKEMAKRVKERVDGYARLLEELIQPDAGLASMNECGFFEEREHERIVKGYRRLMRIIRRQTLAELRATPEAYREFLTEAIPAWRQEKEWLLTVAERLADGWKNGQPLQTEKGYFG